MLATLWKVTQTSAALVMQQFYDALAATSTMMDKARALQEAMLTVRATPGFDAPYYWAPFVLHGDWH